MTTTRSRGGPALLLLLAASCVARGAPADTASRTSDDPARATRSVSANCPVLRADVTVGSSSGAPGSLVRVSGPLYYLDEAGEVWVDEDDTVEAWWNVEQQDYPSVALAAIAVANGSHPHPEPSGTVSLAGAGRTEGACSFDLEVTVPHVPPGTYPVTVLRVGGSDGSASAYGSFRYTVI